MMGQGLWSVCVKTKARGGWVEVCLLLIYSVWAPSFVRLAAVNMWDLARSECEQVLGAVQATRKTASVLPCTFSSLYGGIPTAEDMYAVYYWCYSGIVALKTIYPILTKSSPGLLLNILSFRFGLIPHQTSFKVLSILILFPQFGSGSVLILSCSMYKPSLDTSYPLFRPGIVLILSCIVLLSPCLS